MAFFSGSKRNVFEEWLERLSPLIGARSCQSVTPSDSADLAGGVCRAIYATAAGNINIVFADDDPSTGAQVIAFNTGEVKAIQARRIYSTSTTATGIKALY